ncbi:MAG TPA: DMT family transporter [Chloroflexota bacterium]|nr:DMT family transporter [Chloroflexota bacterium]
MSFGSRRLFDYVELLVAMALWGSLYPASKPVLVQLSPVQVALARSIIAFLILGALVLLRGKGHQALSEFLHRPWPSASLGLLAFLFSSLLAMLAVRYLPASVVGMLTSTSPLWLSLATIVLYRPPDSARMLLGAGIALAGVGMVLFKDGVAVVLAGRGLDPVGIFFALLCAIVIAMQAAWGRRVMAGRDPMVVTCMGCAWSLPPLLALAVVEGKMDAFLALSGPTLGIVLYLGIGCTALNFALFNDALKRVPAARAAAFQYLVPFLSALFAYAFLGESITWPLIAGGLAIVFGLVLTQERQRSMSRS